MKSKVTRALATNMPLPEHTPAALPSPSLVTGGWVDIGMTVEKTGLLLTRHMSMQGFANFSNFSVSSLQLGEKCVWEEATTRDGKSALTRAVKSRDVPGPQTEWPG